MKAGSLSLGLDPSRCLCLEQSCSSADLYACNAHKQQLAAVRHSIADVLPRLYLLSHQTALSRR